LPLPPSTGETFYVAPGGYDTNPGTESAPWGTVQHALDVLEPGQKALVHAGTYTADLEMRREGTATAPITVAAYPGEHPVLHAASTSGDTYPIEIKGAYFRLQGFVIENSIGTSAANVYFEAGAHDVELSDNEIRYSQDQGIFADRTTSGLQILGNRIHDNGWNHVSGQHQSHGLYIEGGADLIANNIIYNQPYGFGIQLYPANHDSIVTDNTVVANGHSGVVVGGSGGVFGIVIRNNILASNASWGVEADSTCPIGLVLVDHNLFYGNPAGEIEPGCTTIDSSGGNLAGDPLFADPGANDFHLLAGSPAIDQALPAWSELLDADGTSRLQGLGPDLGAYEALATP
jgi:hypothetical protein